MRSQLEQDMGETRTGSNVPVTDETSPVEIAIRPQLVVDIAETVTTSIELEQG